MSNTNQLRVLGVAIAVCSVVVSLLHFLGLRRVSSHIACSPTFQRLVERSFVCIDEGIAEVERDTRMWVACAESLSRMDQAVREVQDALAADTENVE